MSRGHEGLGSVKAGIVNREREQIKLLKETVHELEPKKMGIWLRREGRT